MFWLCCTGIVKYCIVANEVYGYHRLYSLVNLWFDQDKIATEMIFFASVFWNPLKQHNNIGFLGQFRKKSSQFNHQSIVFRAQSNSTTEKGHSFSFYD